MLKRIIVALSVLTLGSSVAFAADQAAAEKLVDSVAKGQLTITQSFPAVGGLEGFVLSPKSGQGQGMIGYTDASAHYLFIGNVIGADGTNYTQQYTQKYIQSKVAKAAYAAAPNTAWFVDGSDKAPHKMYVVIDANCIFCHLMYKELNPLIQSGQLQVRWIAAGFLKPTSVGMAAQILYAATPAKQVALFDQNQAGFNQQQEQGGIQPLAKNDKDMAVNIAYAKVFENTEFFNKYGFEGTPVLLYKQPDGTPAFYPGYVKGDQLTQLLTKVGNAW